MINDVICSAQYGEREHKKLSLLEILETMQLFSTG